MGCDRVPGWSGMSGNAESGRASAWLPITYTTMLNVFIRSQYTVVTRLKMIASCVTSCGTSS